MQRIHEKSAKASAVGLLGVSQCGENLVEEFVQQKLEHREQKKGHALMCCSSSANKPLPLMMVAVLTGYKR